MFTGMTEPWTAAVAAGKATCILIVAYILWKVAYGFSEWLRAYRVLARQRVPKPPVFEAFKDLSRADIHRIGPFHEKEFGGFFWAHLLHYHIIIVSEPTMVTQVLDRQLYPEVIDKPKFLYSLMNEGTAKPACPSLVSAGTSDMYWKLVRKGVSPAFAQSNVRTATETSIAMAYRLADTLEAHDAKEALDMDAAMQNAAFDVIGVFGFGKDFRATLDLHGEGAQACKCLSDGMMCAIKRQLRPDNRIPYTPAWNLFVSTQKKLLGIFKNLMKESLARGEPAEEDQSISAFLRRIRSEDGSPLSELRFWSESSIMFFAGVETTGHTLGFVLLFISQHPDVEARILHELQELGVYSDVQGKPSRALTYADIQKLTYLQCVIKESQRLMPVVPLVARCAMKDVAIGNTVVPRNALLIPHFLAMHTSHRHWERPLDFIPEELLDHDCEYARHVHPSSSFMWASPSDIFSADVLAKGLADIFAADRKTDSRVTPLKPALSVNNTCNGTKTNGHDPFIYKGQRVKRYMPYAAGSRGCVGRPQAQVTMLATLAALLSRFSFRLAERMGTAEDVRKAEVYRITVSHKDGLWMYCQPRRTSESS